MREILVCAVPREGEGDDAMLRRTMCFLLTVATSGYVGYLLAWHPEMFGEGFALLRTLGALAAFVAAIAFLTIDIPKLSRRAERLIAVALGFTAAFLAVPLWGAIVWASIGWLLLVVAVLALLWVGTVMLRPGRRVGRWIGRLRSASSSSTSTASPSSSGSTATP